MSKKILVISPHPDDESIGCGGAIGRHTDEGDRVEVVFLTSGEKGGHGKEEEETIIIREKEAKRAADILNVFKTTFWREPDGKFEAIEKNIIRLIEKISEFKPDIIYCPHPQEEHPDHKAAAKLVELALSHPNNFESHPMVLMYEIWTPLQRMDHIVDISPFVDLKRKAILAHKSQCDVLKFEEAILGLNRYRGEMHSWPGGEYAEVFVEMKN